jgi:hypothetical protein
MEVQKSLELLSGTDRANQKAPIVRIFDHGSREGATNECLVTYAASTANKSRVEQ